MKAKKGLKKVLAWGMSIVCMLAMVLAGSPMTAKASASTLWNFKNTGFKNLGTISLAQSRQKSLGMEQHIHMHWHWAAAVRQAIVQLKYRYREQTPLK